jgi:hypothetical protein
MINNQEEFKDMEANSNTIKEMSYEMKNKAKHLERETRKRNCRLNAVIACLAVSAILYFILPIFVDS